MSDFSWLALHDDLSPPSLTVQAQALPVNDDGRQFYWDIFMPRRDVDSTKLRDLTQIDDRGVADRRAWGARGRRMAIKTPAIRDLEMLPIEVNSKFDEQEMQRLAELAARVGNADQIIRDQVMASIPGRVDTGVGHLYRRVEADFATAWANQQVTVKNPETGATVTSTYGFSASRYQTAGTAWNDGGINGYDTFMNWYEAARDVVGAGAGVVIRTATLNAILADAPTVTAGTIRLTRAQVQDYIQQSLGEGFQFFVADATADFYADGGLTQTRSAYWPAQKVAFVPARIEVGSTAFAPQIRTTQMVAQAGPAAGIDVRGVSVFYENAGQGRELNLEMQLNALPVPNEQYMYVIDAGV